MGIHCITSSVPRVLLPRGSRLRLSACTDVIHLLPLVFACLVGARARRRAATRLALPALAAGVPLLLTGATLGVVRRSLS